MNLSGEVKVGTIFMQEGLLLPVAFNIVSGVYSSGWQRVSEIDSIALDRHLRELGWGFSFVAGELKAASFGSSRARMLKAAVGKLLAQVRSQDFNCAEFTKVTSSHFLGIPYVSVRGHARHIQRGCELDTAEKRKHQQSEADWALQ